MSGSILSFCVPHVHCGSLESCLAACSVVVSLMYIVGCSRFDLAVTMSADICDATMSNMHAGT